MLNGIMFFMEDITDQINRALNANLYYLALFVSISLPDICGATESSDGKSTGAKYIAWFDKYVAPNVMGNYLENNATLFVALYFIREVRKKHLRVLN